METITNAANAAASYLGYDQTADKAQAGDTLSEIVHDRNATGTSTSGIEPVSGKLGSGTAGQPYDAGNSEVYDSNTSGLTGSGTRNTTSGGVGSTLSNLTGHGQNTSSSLGSSAARDSQYDSRGLGAEAEQQGNHYTSTAVAGKLPSATGLAAAHRVDDDSSRHTGSSQNTHGHHDTSAGFHSHGLGSDRSSGHASDRYLFDARNAPGAGGQHSKLVDDFTDSNIHNEGSGHRITGELGSDANSGKAGIGAAGAGLGSGYTGPGHNGHHSSTGTGLSSSTGLSQKGTERSRKPGFERMGSGLSYGNTSHGLNSGAPRESIGTKIERRAEEAGLAAAAATGVGAASHSGREPVSGQRGSGVAGEPFDQGNKYDGSSVNQVTSGIGGLNLRDRQAENPYPTSQTSYATGDNVDPSKSNSGLNLVGFSGRNANSQTGTSGPGYDGYSGPNKTNESRLAEDGRDFGATAPRNERDIPGSGLTAGVAGTNSDDCVENHHNAHPIGEGAHVDGTHKPTFLNYQNDQFGVPVARGN